LIFIAGASGFVGGHLVDYLLAKGHRVNALPARKSAKKSLSAKGAEVISGDITHPETLTNILSPEDFVVHLVGIIEERGAQPSRLFITKAQPTWLQRQNMPG